MNEDMITTIIIGIIIIISLYHPLVAIAFLTLTFVGTLIHAIAPKSTHSIEACKTCMFYDVRAVSCMYTIDGKLDENCTHYMEKK